MIAIKRKVNAPRDEWLKYCQQYGVSPSNTFIAEYGKNDTVVVLGLGNSSWLTEHFDINEGDGATKAPESPAAGRKFDGDKARVDLLVDGCPKALMAISDVLTYGAKKYDDHNWQVVPNGPQRYKAAMMRHILAHASGESVDSETGISHLAHAACCVMFMLELELKKDA